MIIRDLYGNRITEGTMLHWLSKDIGAVVTRVTEAQGAVPAMVTVQVTIPVDVSKLPMGAEPQLGDFVCVVNPAAERAIEKVMEMGKRGTGGRTQ